MTIAESFATDMIVAYKQNRIEDYLAYLYEQDDSFFDEFGDDIDEAIAILTADIPLTEGVDATLDEIYDWQEMTEGLGMFLKDRAQAIGNILHSNWKRNNQLGRHTYEILSQKKELASARRSIVSDAKHEIHNARSLKNRIALAHKGREENKELRKNMREAKRKEFGDLLRGKDATQHAAAAEEARKKFEAARDKNGVLGIKGERSTVKDSVDKQKDIIKTTRERENTLRGSIDDKGNETDKQRQEKAVEPQIINAFHKEGDAPASPETIQAEKKEDSEKAAEKEAEQAPKPEPDITQAEKNFNKEESVENDYRLYKLLIENGYIPSKKNLDDLKEGLTTGKYILLDSQTALDENAPIMENASLLEMLNDNGYDASEENLELLKEMIDLNKVLFF